jgi:hypothetical protein
MKLVIILPNNLGIMNINLMEVLLFSFKVPEGKLQVTLIFSLPILYNMP